jgi:hypothetical protein
LRSIAIAGDSLLVAGQGGVPILDISNPRSPQFRSLVELDGEAISVKAAGNLGFTALGATVVLFNTVTGEILDQHSYSELEVNDLALVADSLYVVSADSEAPMRLVISLSLPAGCRSMPRME